MVPNRTIPFANGLSTRIAGTTRLDAARSAVQQLLDWLNRPRRQARHAEEDAYLRRLDRALDRIEHETCDCI